MPKGIITKKRIGVLMGGGSSERDISVRSGLAIYQSLQELGQADGPTLALGILDRASSGLEAAQECWAPALNPSPQQNDHQQSEKQRTREYRRDEIPQLQTHSGNESLGKERLISSDHSGGIEFDFARIDDEFSFFTLQAYI